VVAVTDHPALPRRVAIVTPIVHAGDAVGTDTVEMATELESRGVEVALFAETVRGISRPSRPPPKALDFAVRDDDIVLYHFSYGWAGAEALLSRARCRRVIKYHNVTPPAFFEPYSPAFTQACRAGRAAIAPLVGLGCERYIADSRFNLEELVDAGLARERGGVVPPFNRIERLIALQADLALVDRGTARVGPTFLMVGRLAPNKGHLQLLEALARYRRRFRPDASLVVVGKRDSRLSRYSARIDERVAKLGLGDAVRFVEDASEAELKAAYLGADALVMASEHEGFCVPLVEAMALGVPVVCGDRTALPETAGHAAIVVDTRNPDMVADALDHVVRDARLRGAMRELGRTRYEREFSSRAIGQRLVEELAACA